MKKKKYMPQVKIQAAQEKKEVEPLVIIFSIIFFGVTPLINCKPAYDYTVIKDVLGALSVAIFGLFLYLSKEEKIFLHKAGFIAAAVLFSWILIGCFYAPVKYGAGQALENYLLYYLLFITGMLWRWKKRDAFIWAAAMLIASITAFIQYPKTHYPISTFGNPNFFAGHLLMPIFLSLYFFKKKMRAVAIAYLAITLAALLITKSRASLFAFFSACSFVNFLLLKNHRIPWLKYAGFFIIAATAASLWHKIHAQFVEDIRFYIWKGTWKLIQAKIAAGWGTGNFIFYYPYFRFREYFLRPQATPITNHPHCQYLELWSENGIIALVLFGILLSFAIHNGVKKSAKTSYEIFVFASTGIIAVLIDNILSTNLTNTSTAMYFWFLMGLCFSWNNDSKAFEISGTLKKILSMAAFVSMLILGIWKTYYRIVPEIYLKSGIAAREAGDFVSAIENYKKVCKINGNHVVAFYKMAFAYGQIGDLKNAEETYLKINNNLFPHFAKTDGNLGTLYMQMQDLDRAKFYYEIALWFNPYDIDVLFGLVSIKLFHEKDIKGAKEYLKKAAAINPEHQYIKYLLKTVPELKDTFSPEKQKNK
ncbi:MAG: O-antigen ligase family protein [Candidatus Omnitrophica bacterium]|nr:O-antigen ligase family protein [Candidatus Omnitrophota bacterium]